MSSNIPKLNPYQDGTLSKPVVPYEMIARAVLRHCHDSDCMAAYCHIMSWPENFTINPQQVRKQFGWGENKVYKVFKKMQKLKMLDCIVEHGTNGRFVKWTYKLLDWTTFIPLDETHQMVDFTGSAPFDDFPRVDNEGHKVYSNININLDSGSSLLSDQEKDKKEIKDFPVFSKRRKKRKSNLSKEEKILFDKFYKIYPKKKDIEEARLAFQDYHSWEDLKEIEKDLIELKRAKRDPEWLKQNGQFIPYPATYLRNRRWEDEWQDPSQEPLVNSEIVDKFERIKSYTDNSTYQILRKADDAGELPSRYKPVLMKLEGIFGRPATSLQPNSISLNGGTNSSHISGFFDRF